MNVWLRVKSKLEIKLTLTSLIAASDKLLNTFLVPLITSTEITLGRDLLMVSIKRRSLTPLTGYSDVLFIMNEWNNGNSNRLKCILSEMSVLVSPSWPDMIGTGWPAGYISEGPSCRRGRPAQWPPDSALHQRSRTGPEAEGPSSAQKHKGTQGGNFQYSYGSLSETIRMRQCTETIQIIN